MKADDIQENRNWMQDNNHKKVDKQCYKQSKGCRTMP